MQLGSGAQAPQICERNGLGTCRCERNLGRDPSVRACGWGVGVHGHEGEHLCSLNRDCQPLSMLPANAAEFLASGGWEAGQRWAGWGLVPQGEFQTKREDAA